MILFIVSRSDDFDEGNINTCPFPHLCSIFLRRIFRAISSCSSALLLDEVSRWLGAPVLRDKLDFTILIVRAIL